MPSKFFSFARRPVDKDGIHEDGVPEAEVQTRVGGGLKAGIGSNLRHLHQAASRQFHPGAESIPIGRLANEFEPDPVSAAGRLVSQKHGRAVEHALGAHFPSRHSRNPLLPSREPHNGASGPCPSESPILRTSLAFYCETTAAAQRRSHQKSAVDLGIYVAVGDENVLPAVIVKIQKFNSKSQKGNADRSKARRSPPCR